MQSPKKRQKLDKHDEDIHLLDSRESESDEESDEDKDEEETKTGRNADFFTSKDPDSGQLFVLVGKSERGKTHFLKWLMMDQMFRAKNPVKTGIAFVGTKFKGSYGFLPQDRVFEGYNPAILKQYISNLKKEFEEKGKLEPSFLICDDLLGILNNDESWFNNFMGTFRQYNITMYVAVQYLTGRHAISPTMREQTSYCIMFNSKTNKTIGHLYENYGQLFPSKQDFQDYYWDNTEPSKVGPYVCIVYKESEDRLEENYIPMRAPKELPFKGKGSAT